MPTPRDARRPHRLAVTAGLILALLVAMPPFVRAQAPTFYSLWGAPGNTLGKFYSVDAVGGQGSGMEAVIDAALARLSYFSPQGRTFMYAFFSYGSGPEQCMNPTDLTFDFLFGPHLYIADAGNHRIQSFVDGSGHLADGPVWGGEGTGDGQFLSPTFVTANRNAVYVSDPEAHRIQKFSPSGQFLGKWGVHGSGDGQFLCNEGIFVDGAGHVLVADACQDRVQVFDADGNFQTSFGSTGTGDGQFRAPWDVAMDRAGNIYVVEHDGDRVQRFTSGYAFSGKWGSTGTGPGQFRTPTSVAVDTDGMIIVADHGNLRVQAFYYMPVPSRRSSWGALKAHYR